MDVRLPTCGGAKTLFSSLEPCVFVTAEAKEGLVLFAPALMLVLFCVV